MKQWRKSSRWRNAWKPGISMQNKIRLNRLVEGRNPFHYTIDDMVFEDSERIMDEIFYKSIKSNPFLKLF